MLYVRYYGGPFCGNRPPIEVIYLLGIILLYIVFKWSRTNLIDKVDFRAVTLKACVFYQTAVKMNVCLYPIFFLNTWELPGASPPVPQPLVCHWTPYTDPLTYTYITTICLALCAPTSDAAPQKCCAPQCPPPPPQTKNYT